jgi:hypothetical protein
MALQKGDRVLKRPKILLFNFRIVCVRPRRETVLHGGIHPAIKVRFFGYQPPLQIFHQRWGHHLIVLCVTYE